MRRLSQVFLANEEVLEKISRLCRISKDDVVLEIGAGKGQLTKHLVGKARKVIALELDKSLVPFLKDVGAYVENGNILDYRIPDEVSLIVGNVPYHLSSKILEKVLRAGRRAVLLFQKEFAERLIAKPGTRDYSRISVLVQEMSVPKILLRVNRNSFRPVPKVDSALVEFVPKRAEFDEQFFNFVRNIFRFKKKKLRNALIFSYGKSERFDDADGFLGKRVFELSIDEMKRIYNHLNFFK